MQNETQREINPSDGCSDTSVMNRSNTSVIYERKTSAIIKYDEKKDNNNKRSSPKFHHYVLRLIKAKEERTTKGIGALILLGFMLLLFVISVTGFFVMWFTEYYNNKMLNNIILRKNSETALNWQDPKYDTLLKVHIFNYTNMPQYLAGIDDKIKVVDVGPLIYQEHTKKVNVKFNDNHTVTFRDHRSYKFLPEKSSCREDDKFYLPNVPLFTAAVKVDKMWTWKKIAAKRMIDAFNEPAFKTLTASEFLWGYRDRIVSLDFGTGETHFGLLKNRNGTSVDSLQINTGEGDIRKFSIITQFNGMPLMDFWSEVDCNRIDGSDASMFPPHLVENRSTLHVFLQVLCRKIPLHFEKEVTIFNDIDVLRYRTPLDVFARPEINPNNYCYCHNTDQCLPSGVINATKCYNGAPIYPSFPHFFSGDPIIYKDIEGINPEADLHQTFADIHPRFAFPISGASRIQINIGVHKKPLIIDKVQRIEEGTILPLIWIEITSGNFTEEILSDLYISTFGLDAIQNALKYGTLFFCLASFGLIIASVYNLRGDELTEEEIIEDKKMMQIDIEICNTLKTSSNGQIFEEIM